MLKGGLAPSQGHRCYMPAAGPIQSRPCIHSSCFGVQPSPLGRVLSPPLHPPLPAPPCRATAIGAGLAARNQMGRLQASLSSNPGSRCGYGPEPGAFTREAERRLTNPRVAAFPHSRVLMDQADRFPHLTSAGKAIPLATVRARRSPWVSGGPRNLRPSLP
jgi:hypothetical protein